ncbi:MAG: beta-lactamase family protein [Clostridia bacterium]|nr:beta-lactamase family protein [Clostridia bacterium]
MYIDKAMKKLLSVSIILSLLLSFSSCISTEIPEETKEHETLSGEALLSDEAQDSKSTSEEASFTQTEEFAALKKKADEIASSYSATAVQAAVIKNGKLYFTYEYGKADIDTGKEITSDTKLRIASLSKLVTDIIFMALCDEGLVSLDGDIGDYLGFPVRNPGFPDKVITPAMLMSHTGSIIDTGAFLESRLSGSSSSIKELLSSDAFAYYEPGTYYSYSNFSVALIGSIAELVTKTPFEELAKKYVFTPLGIDAGFTASAVKNQELIANLYGNGGYSVAQQMALSWHETLGQTHHLVQGNLTISAKDYMNIAAVLSNGGVSADGTRLLSEKAAQELLKVRYESDSFKSCFGLLKQSNVIEGTEVCTHTGSNFGMFSAFTIDPVTGNGVAVLTSGAPGTKDTATDIYSICLEIIRTFYPA